MPPSPMPAGHHPPRQEGLPRIPANPRTHAALANQHTAHIRPLPPIAPTPTQPPYSRAEAENPRPPVLTGGPQGGYTPATCPIPLAEVPAFLHYRSSHLVIKRRRICLPPPPARRRSPAMPLIPVSGGRWTVRGTPLRAGEGANDDPPSGATHRITKCSLPSKYRATRGLAPPRPGASTATTPPAPLRPRVWCVKAPLRRKAAIQPHN